MSLSPEQREAVAAPVGPVLVAAGAGVGKTEVLAARAVSLLTDPRGPLPADRLLVVTFTEAAALQMRRRIEERLAQALAGGAAADGRGSQDERDRRDGGDGPEGAPWLRAQPERLRRAVIGTLHSFCLWLLRRHFDALGLDPSFRVLGEAEAAALSFSCCERAVEEEAAALAVVGAALGGGAADQRARAVRLVLRWQRFLESVPDPDGWLAEVAAASGSAGAGEADGGDEAVSAARRRAAATLAASLLRQAVGWLEQALAVSSLPGGPTAYLERLRAERDMLMAVAGSLDGRPGGAPVPAELSWGRLPPARGGAADEALRELAADLRQQGRRAAEAALRLAGPEAEEDSAPTAAGPVVRALLHLLRRYRRAWRETKARLGCLDFADLEHLALAALADDGVAAAVRGRFGAVLVDEYQDVNPVQQAILDRLAGAGDHFLVGDARQSIYGFRHADPEGFCARHAAWSAGGGAVVSLSGNRRSRAGVLEVVNFVFRQLDREAVAAGAWPPAEPLRAAGGFPPPDPPVELHLVERPSRGEKVRAEAGEEAGEEGRPAESGPELEALVVAVRLRQLVEGEPGVEPARLWEPGTGAWRPMSYDDVAILLRAPRGRGPFVEALRRAGVPVAGQGAASLPAVPEVRAVLALLAVLDNPRQDPHLAVVLLSPLGGLLPADLALVRGEAGGVRGSLYDALRRGVAAGVLGGDAEERARRFLERLARWRRAARSHTLPKLLGLLYEETGILGRVAAWPGGARRRACLLALQDRARAWQDGRAGGLGEFVRFFLDSEDGVRELAASSGAPAVGSEGEGVRILSIHAAKGLEFPVVVVADLGRAFDARDRSGGLLLDRRLGLGLRWEDEEGRRAETPAYGVLAEAARRAQLAEEMRLLYVAMTRARERLILVGSAADLPSRSRRWAAAALIPGWSLGPALVWGASSHLDWLGPAVARHRHGGALRECAGWPGGWEPRGEVAAHPARWEVRVWRAPPRPVTRPADSSFPWETVARLEPAALDAPAARLAAVLGDRCDWSYPWRGAEGVPAKLPVSRLAAAGAQGNGGAGPGEPAGPAWVKADWSQGGEAGGGGGGIPGGEGSRRRPAPLRRPSFAAREGLTPAERGEAVHRFLQRLDLSRPLDEAGLAAQREEMVRSGFLTEAEAAGLAVERLAAFLEGPVGGLLRQGAGRLRREVSFYMRVPAAEVRPELAGTAAGRDHVLVQGVMDAVLVDPGGVTLFEFKTGTPGDEELARYQAQVRLYARAARDIYGRPVRAAWLCLLDAGRALAVDVTP